MKSRILNIEDIKFRDWGHGERFAARLGEIAPRIGAQKLGYNLTVVPAGKRAFPLHNHRVNEEMFFIVEGEGEIRIGAERHKIRRGDVIACPPGGPETAHQIVNTAPSGDLMYLAVSTMLSPEVVDYPDSGKFGVRAELSPGPDGKPTTFRFLGRSAMCLDYWDGE
jgi:uncharacterized cupin superfamily protein